MSGSWQHQLISRIIRSGELNPVLQWGITTEDFTMAETRAFFMHILAYFTSPDTAGSVWGLQSIREKFPNWVICDDPTMSTEALCFEVRKDRIKIQSKQLMIEAQDIVDSDPLRAVSLLQERTAVLRNECTSKKVDVHISESIDRNWNSYCGAERGDRVSVFPWPWPPLQNATLGVRDSDYIIIYGRPKSMKSWVLCYLIAKMIDLSTDYRVLVYSKEMPADEIFERIGCILAGVSYENWVGVKMTPEERTDFQAIMHMLQALRDSMVVVCLSAQDVKAGQDTVAWLESKIDKYQPHAVFVDGMYLMSDPSGAKKNNERVAAISRAMRQLVLRRRVPVIATVQANRDAAKNEDANTEEVAFSDSLGQDATMLIRIVNEWKKGANTLALVMGGASRRHKLAGLRIYGMPAVNFGYYGDLSDKEAEAALKVEAAAKQAKNPKPARALKKDDAAEIDKAAADISGLVTKHA